MKVKQGIFGAVTALLLAGTIGISAMAEQVDFLRTIPLDVSGYPAGQAFPQTFTTKEQVIQALNSTPVLLVHMEALRRSYHDLPPSEHAKLLEALHKRRLTNENDLLLGFDHGYAQLVFENNKTGLFFLRKANDKFKTQFSNLAYGMAQVEADLNLEDSTPDVMTTRKMDATYKLGDAVKLDAENHQPGFWPSYMQVIEKMKGMPAYKSFAQRDFSLAYVPYGNTVVPLSGATTEASLPLTAKSDSLLSTNLATPCDPAALASDTEAPPAGQPMVSQSSASFAGNTVLFQFFATGKDDLRRVQVVGNGGQRLFSFNTYDMPRIVEDLDGDGIYEIVARQYHKNPLKPVIVYRYTPCGFELDKKISDSFK